jgi:hypothetical protein
MLKTFLISKPLLFARGAASRSIAELEVAGVEVVTMENTDKYAFVCVCSHIF